MPGGELQLQMLRNLSQAPSSFENQLYFYKTESLDYLLKAGSYKDFSPLEKSFLLKKDRISFWNGEIGVWMKWILEPSIFEIIFQNKHREI